MTDHLVRKYQHGMHGAVWTGIKMQDDKRTKAAMAAYQDAMRLCQTWRHAIRAALAAADAVDGNEPRRSEDVQDAG